MARNAKQHVDLGFLGVDYQMRLVKCFIEHQDYFANLYHIVDQNMFTDEQLRRIVALLRERYSKTETVATYLDLDVLIRTSITDEISIQLHLAMLDKIRTIEIDAYELVEEAAEKFFKQQNLVKAINKAQDIIKKGNTNDYYSIEDTIKNALETNIRQDLGFGVFDNYEDVLSDDYRKTITTGCPELDESLYGGLGKGELGLIIAPLGVGKAQPLTSNILTPDGYKKMGDIKIGDLVIGRDGKPYPVTGVFPQGVRPIYKVSFSNGTSCECDKEHLWSVNTYWQRSRKTYVRGTGVKNRKTRFNPDNSFKTMTLSEIIDKGLIKETTGGYKTKAFKVPNHECVMFNEQQVSVNPYLVGYYIGDGCYQRRSITVGVQDYESAVKNIGNLLNEDCSFHYYDERNIWNISIKGKTALYLKEMLGNCKSEDKFIPKEYLFNTKDVRMTLLQGMMDSDGTISKTGIMEYNTKSKQLSDDFYFLVRSLGAYVKVSVKESGYKDKNGNYKYCGLSYRIRFSFHDNTIVPFKLARKLERVKYRTKFKNQIYITNIEYIGEKEAQCIMVDSDEHLYLTEDFIVTHNTSVTTGFVASAATTPTPLNNFKGYKCLHLFFEDTKPGIQRKYYGYITGVEACDLSKPGYRETALAALEQESEINKMLKENVRCKRLSSGEVTASEIKNIIRNYHKVGFKPDLVVLDYFECLKPEKTESFSDSEWSKEGVSMRKLESICNEMQVAMWVPVQGTKGSIGVDTVTVAHAGGSVKKTQIGHVILTLAQTDEQKQNGKLNLTIGKLRAAKIGRMKYNDIGFNNGTCRFDMSSIYEVDNALDGNGVSSQAQNIAKNVAKENKK